MKERTKEELLVGYVFSPTSELEEYLKSLKLLEKAKELRTVTMRYAQNEAKYLVKERGQ
jgi:thermostable 8-oxoguanine DNA glycosylase